MDDGVRAAVEALQTALRKGVLRLDVAADTARAHLAVLQEQEQELQQAVNALTRQRDDIATDLARLRKIVEGL